MNNSVSSESTSHHHEPDVSRSTLSASSIDQLTLSYLKGEITFQEYETLIENQHFLSITNSTGGHLSDQSHIVSSTIELASNYEDVIAEDESEVMDNVASGSNKSGGLLDRFFSLKDILDDEENDDDDDEEDEDDNDTDRPMSELTTDDTTMSQWNDFDIETLNFDKFIKDHQTDKQKQQLARTSGINTKEKSGPSSSCMSSKRKRGHDDDREGGTSATQGEDPNELRAKRRRNRVLPIEIQGLMGEANLAYARGATNKAIDTCLEVIKYAPKAPEPFQLLSLLYAEQGQNSKSLRVGLIAAQLNKDPQEWEQLIQQAVIEGDVDLVLFCYNNAIQCDPKNIRLHVERVRVLMEKRDARRLMLAKLMLLKYVDVEKDNDIYERYFGEVMMDLKDADPADRAKKIYVLKNDLKKFKEKFAIDSGHIFVIV